MSLYNNNNQLVASDTINLISMIGLGTHELWSRQRDGKIRQLVDDVGCIPARGAVIGFIRLGGKTVDTGPGKRPVLAGNVRKT